jgi:hypothetical protein
MAQRYNAGASVLKIVLLLPVSPYLKFHTMKNAGYTLLLLLLSTGIKSQEHLTNGQSSAQPDTVKHKDHEKYFELSLGHSLLFISSSRLEEIRTNASVIVPTNAILIFAEFRPLKRMRIPLFVNIPAETKQFIVNNKLVSERASPTLGAGLEFRCFGLPIGNKSSVELELGPLASFLVSEKNVVRFAPIVAGRLRFIKNKDFVLYMGSSYSIGIDAVGILFGTGYIF